jgi:type I restriction enzyme S subunit
LERAYRAIEPSESALDDPAFWARPQIPWRDRPGFRGEKRLGDIVDTEPAENIGSETHPDFAFNYIALEDVERGFLRSNTEQVFAGAPSRARRKLRPNDILVSTVRPNLQSHLLFCSQIGNWICSTGFCVVRCRQGVTNPAYVFSHFFAASVNRQIEALDRIILQ